MEVAWLWWYAAKKRGVGNILLPIRRVYLAVSLHMNQLSADRLPASLARLRNLLDPVPGKARVIFGVVYAGEDDRVCRVVGGNGWSALSPVHVHAGCVPCCALSHDGDFPTSVEDKPGKLRRPAILIPAEWHDGGGSVARRR